MLTELGMIIAFNIFWAVVGIGCYIIEETDRKRKQKNAKMRFWKIAREIEKGIDKI